MPLTLTLTKGVLPQGTEKQVFSELSEAMLRLHGLAGNRFMTPNVVGSIHLIDPEHTFSGLNETKVAFVEWKVPSFAFTDREGQKKYVAEATEIVLKASAGKLERDHVWVNVTHAVDGAWGIDGHAYTNAELGEAVSKG